PIHTPFQVPFFLSGRPGDSSLVSNILLLRSREDNLRCVRLAGCRPDNAVCFQFDGLYPAIARYFPESSRRFQNQFRYKNARPDARNMRVLLPLVFLLQQQGYQEYRLKLECCWYHSLMEL